MSRANDAGARAGTCASPTQAPVLTFNWAAWQTIKRRQSERTTQQITLAETNRISSGRQATSAPQVGHGLGQSPVDNLNEVQVAIAIVGIGKEPTAKQAEMTEEKIKATKKMRDS